MIKALNLSYSYEENLTVIDNISFYVKRNEFVSFIGPSGCGKTTLLNIIAGIYKDYKGELKVNSKNISFVFQHESLLSWKNALNNVLFPLELKNKKINKKDIKKAYEILSLVGLRGFEKYFPEELSGGMKKRVEIARALITNPDLIIFDEPFSSVDVLTREKLNLLTKKIKKEKDVTFILVTHSIEEACFLSDRIYVFSEKPSKIVDIVNIENNYSGSLNDSNADFETYFLTDSQINIAREIRKQVKDLWIQGGAKKVINNNLSNKDREKIRILDFLKKNVKNGELLYNSKINSILIPIELILLFFILTLIKKYFKIPDYIFPYPYEILKRFIQTIWDSSIFLHIGITLYESISGFFIAFVFSLISGYFIAKSRILSNLLMPYLIAANTIPSVALAPFLVLWFGFGYTPKIIVSVIVIFFPMLINTISAIHLTNEKLKEFLLFYKTTFIKRFLKIELLESFPIIISGIKVSITLSVIGAVVGEFVSGSKGLGSLVRIAKANFDIELMFVALIWLIIMGLSYYSFINVLEKIILKKRNKTNSKTKQ